MTTGEDLVEWQLRVASGEPLPLSQHDVITGGHAIEVRICAENPDNDFLPETGTMALPGRTLPNVSRTQPELPSGRVVLRSWGCVFIGLHS